MTAYVEFFLLIDACKLYLYTYTLYEYKLQYYPTILYDLFSKIRYTPYNARFSYLIFQFKF